MRSCSRRILDEAATTLGCFYAAQLDDLIIEQLVVGVFFVGVKLSNGCAGVAYTPPEMIKNAGRHILKAESPTLRGTPAATVARGDISSPFAEVIQLATLNALSVPFLENGRYCIDDSGDASGGAGAFQPPPDMHGAPSSRC